MRRRIWLVSAAVVLVSLTGLLLCWMDPSVGFPLRPGLDFTGGTQIQLERNCGSACSELKTVEVQELIRSLELPEEPDSTPPNLAAPRVQLLDGGQSLSLRLPTLTAGQGQAVIRGVEPLAVPYRRVDRPWTRSVRAWAVSCAAASFLLVAFSGIAVYISFRYDRRYALLALVALAHDVTIVCGLFAWLGLLMELEVDSLFAVSLLDRRIFGQRHGGCVRSHP